MSTETAPETPVLRVLTPSATPEEIAAVVAVLTAFGDGGAPAPRKPRSQWGHPARAVRTGLTAGPGAWRASGMPG